MSSPQTKQPPPAFWSLPASDAAEALSVLPEKGLSEQEAQKRLKLHGKNSLREIPPQSSLKILVNQFKSLVVLLLFAAAGISALFHEWLDFTAIVIVIVINTVIGFVTEIRAVRSMESLRQLGSVSTKVRRSGEIHAVSAENLVPGDIVILEGGDVVTADMRLLVAYKLEADESTLTGESMPVAKNIDPVDEKASLADRSGMLYKGTALTRGSGEGVVVATGMNSELGRISSLVEEAGEEEKTPLEKRLDRLAHKLIGVSLVIALLVIVSGILTGKNLFLMIETGIALAIASIPEGLPIVATIALARGMWRMAKRNALVSRLSAVETLGATGVIFTDKTGTLTENRMTVVEMQLPSMEIEVKSKNEHNGFPFISGGKTVDPSREKTLRDILEAMVLCNNASLVKEEDHEQILGDPLELALLTAAEKGGIRKKQLFDKMPELREDAFDSDVKMMATFNRDGDRIRASIKGAPENVLSHCTKQRLPGEDKEFGESNRKTWIQKNNQMAQKGLRVIAVASKMTGSIEEKPYENLVFLGLLGLSDPPRAEVREAITQCRNAGIRIVVVTGDQLITARNVALSVNLIDDPDAPVVHGKDIKPAEQLSPEEKERLLGIQLFARVSPAQKLDLISLHQEKDAIVAMTGDGVNDAPALKKADIGVAMGQRGTQVAREAADMVLKDDSFKTIAMAVEQGRVIYGNIRKFICYLLSCNVSEVMIIFIASLVFRRLPILPLQILFLNFVTDVFPALALGVGEGGPGIMKNPPRNPRESLLTSAHWKRVFIYGFILTVSVLVAFSIALKGLNFEGDKAVTIAFLTLALAQIFHVFNMREKGSGFVKNEITRNPFIWGAVILCIALLIVAVYVPGLSHVLKVTAPGLSGWLLVIAMSLLPFTAGQIWKTMS